MHIVTAKEMYEIDRFAIEKGGIDGRILMENAGRAIVDQITNLVDNTERILVLVGSGNNGGDGFVIARNLLNKGYEVIVLQLVADEKIKGDAAYHKQLFINFKGKIQLVQEVTVVEQYLSNADVVIDAMLGIGISGEVRQPFKQVIEVVNKLEMLTISVDIPSGVPADEGVANFTAIKADYTFVVELPKLSLYLEYCSPFYGQWRLVEIGLPHTTFSQDNLIETWNQKNVVETLPKRNRYSHKGSHGKGLVIGGSHTMPGSVAMTAKAALRSGSGLITVGTVQEAIPSIASYCMEATYISFLSNEGIITGLPAIDFSSYDALAIGMGMGRSESTASITKKVIVDAKIPILIDADGLQHIKGDLPLIKQRQHPTVLTPHPGEMAMLTGYSVKEILTSPFKVSKQFAREHGVYLILKGVHTIISDPNGRQWVNTTGNAGLAKGGSGDVLSGILLSMMMQNQSLNDALTNGCFIHGASADILVSEQRSKQDLVATDVIDGLTSVFRTLI
ncbi:NAD(P)H-hydrate dehydratase [Aquibacillus rhizosphaerae]|uniref:Bifunctional NAD(P)H-hydrate repair enzyme n=1 Tax=Aquibacillus rhizosphaerae TaxID=3051431 RepID=A0ABT7L2R2_9BACI|nr:NAD(P)H-hydrate dehydratase [Aquibacillus sp. LR5S19]MDL4840153.1 NAD(P)H-hydrate dehydratase [Aquibacillus sp. LR5S19]